MKLTQACTELLNKINALKIDLWVEAGKLRFQAPPDTIDLALKQAITTHKAEIINWLESIGQNLQSAIVPHQENTTGFWPIAKEQEVLWQASQLADSDHVYNIPYAYILNGELNIEKLTVAIKKLYCSEKILRVKFNEQEGNINQFVQDEQSILLTCGKLSDDESTIQMHCQNLAATNFNLETGPCVLFDIRMLNSKKHLFTMVLHHIIADAASIELILTRLQQLYLGEDAENTAVDFLDYAVAQNKASIDEETLQTMAQRYQTLPDSSIFPYDKGITKTNSNVGENYQFTLPEALTTAVSNYAKQTNVSLYTVLLAGYFALLRKYARVNQHCVGISISTRNTTQKQNIIGPMLSTGTLLVDASLKETFAALVNQVQFALVSAIDEAQKVSFSDFLVALKKKHHEVGQLFNTIFLLQPTTDNVLELGNCKCEAVDVPVHFAKFDLTFSLREVGKLLVGNIEYKTDLFTAKRIAEIAKHYESILDEFTASPNKKLADSTLKMTKAQNHDQFSTNASLILDRIYKHVQKTPKNIALYDKETEITYATLWTKISCLARQVIAESRGPYVGILLERSIDSVIAMLSVLLAKKAFVPIDHENPAERIHYIVEDASLDCVISAQAMQHLLPNETYKLLVENTGVEWDDMLCPEILPTDNAYMIYTSGSTGKPKGVRINHKNMAHYIDWAVSAYLDQYGVNHALVHSSIAFDLTITSIFAPLAKGGQVFIPAGFGVEVLSQYITEHQNLGLIKLTPSHLRLVKNSLGHAIVGKTGVIVVGGEAFYARDALTLLNNSPALVFINEYGPTETTVGCMQFVLSKENSRQFSPNDSVPIGKAIDRMCIEILDESDQSCPNYIPGEICISGVGVSDGYFGRENLTNEKFITRIDAAGQAYKAYRSGDLALKSDTGDLVYVGRIDEQIKLNGYRIEIGEINNTLALCQGVHIAEAVIVEDQLVCYIVAKPQSDLDVIKLQAHAHAYLPFYMCPANYVFIEKMPLTVNGKLDVKALPKPNTAEISQNVVVQDSLEAKLCEIWAQILENQNIGIRDDFFRIGGDSILSIQLTSELRNQGFDCNIRTIFETRTIEALAQYIRSKENKDQTKLDAESGQLTGSFELLPIQQWFFGRKFVYPNHFNHAFLVRLPQMDLDRLRSVIPELAKHHDILRMQYNLESEPSAYTQQYANEIPIPELLYFDRSKTNDDALKEILTQWQSRFDIEKGPLWQIGYITGYADNTARLFFACHHLIIDSVSWRILIEDIQSLYEGKTLGAKTSSYRQWVKAVRNYCEKSPQEAQYWQTVSQGQADTYSGISKVYHEQVIKLDKSLTRALLEKSNQAYQTEINDLLLTAFAYGLKAWTGNAGNHITLEGHGREPIEDSLDLSRTVGWFTTMYPVKLEVLQDIENSIKSIKEILRSIPTKGLGYGAFKYLSTQLKQANLPPISFNYLGQFKHSDIFWQITNETAGSGLHADNWGKNLLDINGYIADNQLQFNIGSTLDVEVTNQFIYQFKACLEELIEHCVDKTKAQQFAYTPSDFPMVRLSQKLLDKLQESYQIQAIYPANSLQQGFIYHALSHPNDDAYRVQLIYDYFCELDLQHYFEAWNKTVEMYPVLRTCFNWEEELVQIVCKQGHIVWAVHDVSQTEDQEKAIEAIQIADRQRAFDLTQPELLRVHVIKRSNAHYTILKSEHHAISDGWSNAVLFDQVHENYRALLSNEPLNFPEDQGYLNAQAYYYANREQTETYWGNRLEGISHANDLNQLFTVTTDLNVFGKVDDPCEYVLTLPVQSYKSLKCAANEAGVTLNVLCQFAWHKLIHAYTQDTHTIVGTTISGRALPIADIGKSVGLYINTLPFIADWSQTDATIMEQLQKMHQDMMEMDSHGFVQLSQLRQKGAQRFYSIFVFENYPGGQSANALNFKFKQAIEKLDVPVALIVYEENDALHFKLKYAGELISSVQVRRIMMQIQQILESLASGLKLAHADLCLMEENEYQKVVYDWNASNAIRSSSNNLVDLFEQQVKQFPQRVAVVCEDKCLTYQDLDKQSNQLARLIAKKHNGNFVAVCCSRSLEMIIAILATLKAGCAYVPIDPEYPMERIRFILEDSNAGVLLTQSSLAKQLNEAKVSFTSICLDEASYANEEEKPLSKAIQSTDLAYVIYTSGTTGKPKGVMLEHRSVVNYIENLATSLQAGHKNVDFSSSLSFDLSVTTTLGTLLLGNTIQIYADKLDNLDRYIEHLAKNEVHLIKMVPTLYELLSKRLSANIVLREVILGGEKLNRTNLTYHPNITVFDEYGPTEATVGTTLANVFPKEQPGIGKAYDGYKLYVLDKNNIPVPIGVIGELFIGGAGLARGYLNRPELTDERFIKNLFATKEDIRNGYDRLYKTGDLVKWLPDGNLVYHGRNDFQIKLRGFRIELGEIENALNAFDGIEQSAVILQKHTEHQYLVAYYVALHEIDKEALRAHITARLPSYMVPSYLIHLQAIPLTVNGKLNTNALPEFKLTSDNNYLAPTNAEESAVCGIWQEVLSLERVGVQDDFFAIGGYSIAAMQIAHRMSQHLGYNITIVDLLQHRTITNILAHCSTQQTELEIQPIEETQQVALSFAQQRLWFIERYEGGSAAYNVPFYLELSSDIDIDAFKQAIQSVISRHDILRTVFVQDEQGVDYQCVLSEPLKIYEKKIGASQLLSHLETAANSVFDLRKCYPINVTIYHTKTKSYVALIFHHIAFDGWSTGIFFRELNAFYQQIAKHITSDLPALKIQYKDFAVWQRQYLQGEQLSQEIAYWKNTLNGTVTLDFPINKPRPNQIDYSGEYVYYHLPKTLSTELKRLAKAQGTTLYTLMLSAFYVLLYRYTHQSDLVVGTVVANRQYSALENLIGFFVNSLPLRMQLKSSMQFNQLVQQVHELMLQAQMHQALPFEKMVEALQIEKDPSRHPIFQVMFGMHNFDDNAGIFKAPFEFMPTDSTYKVAKFDLSLFIDDTQADLKAVFNYATQLFGKDTIERFARHYVYILEQIVDDNAQPIQAMRVLEQQEARRILHGFNQSKQLSPKEQTIHGCFETLVAKYPQRIALTCQSQSLNYADLNARANQLARYIVKTYQNMTGELFKADTLIPVCLEKGFDLLIATLAILKVGGAYVPIDPNSPQDRMRFILEDTQSRLLITEQKFETLMKAISHDDVTALFVDQIAYQNDSDENLSVPSVASNLAYVIYTSGTTSKPKGVMIEHHSVVDLAVNTSQLKISKDDVMIFLSSPVFDAATFEIWGSLLNGARLVIPKDEKELCSDTNQFKLMLLQEKVTQLWMTKTLFDSLYLRDNSTFDSLDTLLIGGEALDVNLINKLVSQSHRPKKIINGYGPTESTTFATLFNCQSVLEMSSVPIGQTIDQRLGYVLDEDLNPVPIGVIGELYIGGSGLARGYLNRPELNNESFITHHISDASGQTRVTVRLYRTGDLVKYLRDGNLVYIGRNDSQVKIRGYRIELGEIETRLTEHPQINQAVVLVKERKASEYGDNEDVAVTKYIVAYYVSDAEINQDDLLAHLSNRLPNYMLPSCFVHLEMLPQTINGKLDAKALPTPELSLERQSTYVAPKNDRERQISHIWQEVLGVASVGITDDFFRIGGDSILSLQLISKLRDNGYQCSIKAIFEDRTIERLMKRFDDAATQIATQAEQGVLAGAFELLPIQKWFFEQPITHRNHWNQSFLVKIPLLDTKKLENALSALAEQHDVLRLKFTRLNGQHQQHYMDNVAVPQLQVLDKRKLSDKTFQAQLTQWQCNFDIEHGPLWKVGYIFGYEDGSARLYFALHHLIVDAVSWRILLEDIRRLYEGKTLSKKTSSYRQWVNAIAQYPEKHSEELLYWKEHLLSQQEADVFDEMKASNEQKCFGVAKLDKALTKQLLQDANHAYRTQISDLLLTALAYALKDLSAQDQVHVVLEGHGREHIEESLDLSRTVGWFTTIYPIKLTIQDDLSRSIKAIKSELRRLPNKGLGYSAFKYHQSGQYLKETQLPKVSFNYLGQFDSQDGLWQVVRENSGQSMLDQNVGHHILNINGWIIDGELQFEIDAYLAESMANQFVASFERHLDQIVRHCIQMVSRNKVEYISDDFAWNEQDLSLPEDLVLETAI